MHIRMVLLLFFVDISVPIDRERNR
jgi:hypothetical protein